MVSNNTWTKTRRTLIGRRKWGDSRLRRHMAKARRRTVGGLGELWGVRSGRSRGSLQSEARSWRLVNLGV